MKKPQPSMNNTEVSKLLEVLTERFFMGVTPFIPTQKS